MREVADAILPAQFYARRGGSPEMRAIQALMTALIESAVRDWRGGGYVPQSSHDAPISAPRRPRALTERAEKWLFGDSSSATVSFEFACSCCGQDPDALRRMLREAAPRATRRSPAGFCAARVGRQEDAA